MMRGWLIAVGLAACGDNFDGQIDVGSVYIGTLGEPVRAGVPTRFTVKGYFEGCLGPGEARCSVDQQGATLVLRSTALANDCELQGEPHGWSTYCETPPLTQELYRIEYGDRTVELALPRLPGFLFCSHGGVFVDCE